MLLSEVLMLTTKRPLFESNIHFFITHPFQKYANLLKNNKVSLRSIDTVDEIHLFESNIHFSYCACAIF